MMGAEVSFAEGGRPTGFSGLIPAFRVRLMCYASKASARCEQRLKNLGVTTSKHSFAQQCRINIHDIVQMRSAIL
jgi:hypothetical protein